MAYLRGESRDPISLLPESPEDYVAANALVRFIDRFIESLDLKALGFDRTQLASTGRPPYSPGCLLRRKVYGYLHRFHSSRQLAGQARGNVEMKWLPEKQTPEFKTIAHKNRRNTLHLSNHAVPGLRNTRPVYQTGNPRPAGHSLGA